MKQFNHRMSNFTLQVIVFITVLIIIFLFLFSNGESYERGLRDATVKINTSLNNTYSAKTIRFDNDLLGSHISNVLLYADTIKMPDSIKLSYNYLKQITK